MQPEDAIAFHKVIYIYDFPRAKTILAKPFN